MNNHLLIHEKVTMPTMSKRNKLSFKEKDSICTISLQTIPIGHL
jgi:hypothetical protein